MKHFIVSIRPGWPQIVETVEMANRELELDDFNMIEGFIEVIPIPSMPGLKLVIDDEGQLKGLPLNIFASELAKIKFPPAEIISPALTVRQFPLDAIVGPALIAKQKGPELWPIDEEDLVMLQKTLFVLSKDW